MTPAVIAALCTGITGVIGAVTALVSAIKAHQRITQQGKQ